MKIAFFIDDYLPSVHGVATSTLVYKQALESLGHEVFIIAPKVKGYEDNDDHVIRLSSMKNYIFEKRYTASLYPGLAKKLDKYEFDVVHSQTQFQLGVLAHLVARRQNIPHVTTIHTLYPERLNHYPLRNSTALTAITVAMPIVLGIKPILPEISAEKLRNLSKDSLKEMISRQGWRLTAAFANKCDACISPSKHLERILIEEGGLNAPCYNFPNSIDTKKYRSARAEDSPIEKKPGEKFIICVARLSPEKRQITLVDSMAHVSDKNIKLVLAGGGPFEKELRARISELGLEDRVILTGMQSSDKVASLLKQADVFALASYHFDNQPMTFLEASAAGLPIVYCDEQMTEGLRKSNSILTDGIEGKDFAKVFNDLLSNKERLAKMSRAALRVARSFDSLSMAKKLLELYSSLIETRKNLES